MELAALVDDPALTQDTAITTDATEPALPPQPRSVTIPPLQRRALAWLVDSALVGLVGLLITVVHITNQAVWLDILASSFSGFDWLVDAIWASNESFLFGIGITMLLAIAYHWLTVALIGRTLGQLAAGLSVLRTDSGARPDLMHAAMRAVLVVVGFIFFGLGHYWRIVDRFQRGWHDLASDTMVVAIDGRQH